MTVTVEVFDPSMCCSTGVCGPSVDPVLPRFAADLEWLAQQGIRVTRHNLAQEPAAFAAAPAVQAALTERGTECLPLIMVDGRVVSQGVYPTRAELAGWTGRDRSPVESLYSASVAELSCHRRGDRRELRALLQVPLRPGAQARRLEGGHGACGRNGSAGERHASQGHA